MLFVKVCDMQFAAGCSIISGWEIFCKSCGLSGCNCCRKEEGQMGTGPIVSFILYTSAIAGFLNVQKPGEEGL